jgi:hypothetical protein
MQMLAAGGIPPFTDALRVPDAFNPHGYFEHEQVKSIGRDARFLCRARGHALKIVVPLVESLPPQEIYRVLLLERELADVIDSQDRMLAASGVRPDPLPRASLERVFSDQLERTRQSLARRAIPCLELRFRNLRGDARSTAARIASFTGRALDVNAMERCVDPELARPRTLCA